MADAGVTRRRFLALGAGAAAGFGAGPLLTGRLLGVASAATSSAKGIAPGKLMYLSAWELAQSLDIIADTVPGGWVRTDFDWARVERLPGVFDWTGPDRVMDAVGARGLQLIAILGTCPSWANGGRGQNVPPLSPSSMAPFVRAAAARYGPQGTVFEIWNEPNYDAFWSPPNAAAYTRLLKVAYSEIKKVSPSSLVLTGGLAAGASPRPVDFLQGIYSSGGRGYFDAVAYHPYCSYSAPLSDGSGFLATSDVHDVMAANGDGAKQVWGTEIGWRVGLFRVSESTQATYLSQAFSQWNEWNAAGWVGPLLWFNLKDESMTLLDFSEHSQYGLVRSDWTYRPAQFALANA